MRPLGPGLVTGAADADPSGITAYSVAGASLGHSLLWMAWLTYPLMAAIQLVCARIGTELVVRRSTFAETMGAPGYGALVAAMSRALGAPSRDIATAIGELPH